VEDSENDCLLLTDTLTQAGYEVTSQRVETGEAMSAALAHRQWDIVISDHRMPQFNSLAALKLLKEHASNIPFIVVSGSIGEELAVTAMKAGAHDYIMKDNLVRLVPAVERELRDAESRRQRGCAERALEQSLRRTESILEAAGEGICGLDAGGIINFINPRGAKSIGWEAGELIGKSLHETIHHSRADGTPFLKSDCSLCATLRDGLAHWMDDEVFWRQDRSSIPVAYTCMPMHEGEKTVGAVLTFQDITERKNAEVAVCKANRCLERSLAELRRTQQQVVEQERLLALGQMADGVAHDFNNSLSKVLGFTELLLTSPDKLRNTETVRDHLRKINTAARKAARDVHRLHEFYRPRRDTELLKVVNLNAVVEQAISLTEPNWKGPTHANGAGIQIRTDLQPKISVFGDEVELRDALSHLIVNAVDAMPHGGAITIHTSGEGGIVRLRLSDTGAGMTEKVRQHCFEPFFSTKGKSGAGLGLSSAHGIIRRHGGEIAIQSQPGQGTTFTIRLPIHSRHQAKPPKIETPLIRRNSRLHVLVVEDEPMIQGIEVEYLVSDGHTVETADDGCEGLSKFRSGRFDLVLVDRAMPEVNGDQLTDAIKELDPDMPIILVTAFADPLTDDRERGRSENLVLPKPFSRAGLREAVGKVLSVA
jgi:PAS domain S-box-containing protein